MREIEVKRSNNWTFCISVKNNWNRARVYNTRFFSYIWHTIVHELWDLYISPMIDEVFIFGIKKGKKDMNLSINKK
jgi:hypothetical protein